jgi:hypothetical protein
MVCNGRLCDGQVVHDIGDRALLAAAEFHDLLPGGIGDRLGKFDGGGSFPGIGHDLFRRNHIDKCQFIKITNEIRRSRGLGLDIA